MTDPSKSGSQEEIEIGRPLRPNELGTSSIFNWSALTGNYGNETAKFEGEPSRGQLTQPPPGYQTPSASQPYGTASDSGPGWKIPTDSLPAGGNARQLIVTAGQRRFALC